MTAFSTQIVSEKAQSLMKYYTNDLEEDFRTVTFPPIKLQNVQ